MRKCLPLLSLFTGLLLTTHIDAQRADRTAFAITDVKDQYGNWVYLRQLNMETGQFSDALLNGSNNQQVAYDAATKKQISSFSSEVADRGFSTQPAFNSGVAALAYDKKNNRLWYTPMFIDQLRYIDLKTMKVYYVTDNILTGITKKSPDQGNIITRMVIAADGNGYAMTNDGMHFLQFTTGKKIKITDLGQLADDPANKGLSVHNSCSSFGGDMIADDNGNLIVFSARNHVFKINVESKVATHLGNIKDLPANFTVNGVAVTNDNKIIAGSAMESSSYYYIDMKTLTATPYTIQGTVWHSSDLASSNLLATRTAGKGSEFSPLPVFETGSSKISIYPNPVTENQFAVRFADLEEGNYMIVVTDVNGRQILQQPVNVSSEGQIQQVNLEKTSAKGVYLVQVMNKENKSVFTSKVLVQ
jgi:hypothetical protein